MTAGALECACPPEIAMSGPLFDTWRSSPRSVNEKHTAAHSEGEIV